MKRCPECNSLSMDETQNCICGYDFLNPTRQKTENPVPIAKSEEEYSEIPLSYKISLFSLLAAFAVPIVTAIANLPTDMSFFDRFANWGIIGGSADEGRTSLEYASEPLLGYDTGRNVFTFLSNFTRPYEISIAFLIICWIAFRKSNR